MLDPHLYCCLHTRGEYQNHGDSYLCTRFRVDGIKVISRDISGGQTKDKICQCDKLRSTLFIFSKRNDELMVMRNVRFEFRQS